MKLVNRERNDPNSISDDRKSLKKSLTKSEIDDGKKVFHEEQL